MANFANVANGLPTDWVPVTPNNTTDNMTTNTRQLPIGFYITTGGTVTFTVDGVDRVVTFPSNFIVPCVNVTRIKATGTTATGIFSLVI